MAHQVRLWIFAEDAGRAHAFHARVFGWSLPDHPRRCWLITDVDDPRLGADGPATMGPESADEITIPTVHVTDLDATTAAALAAGGEVLVPRVHLPRVGWVAYIADTEGNVIGIMQDDPSPAQPADPGSGRSAATRDVG